MGKPKMMDSTQVRASGKSDEIFRWMLEHAHEFMGIDGRCNIGGPYGMINAARKALNIFSQEYGTQWMLHDIARCTAEKCGKKR